MDISHPKKKPTAGRALVKFLLVLVLVSAAIILIAMSPVFRVREIGVKGINRYTASEVARKRYRKGRKWLPVCWRRRLGDNKSQVRGR